MAHRNNRKFMLPKVKLAEIVLFNPIEVLVMDIYNCLNKDHKAMSKLMQKLASSKTVRERASIFEAIKTELMAQAETEDSFLRQALAGQTAPTPRYSH